MASAPDPLQGHTPLGSLDKLEADKLHDRLGASLTEWLKQKTGQIEQKVDLKMDGLQREVAAKLDGKPGHLSLIAHTLAVVVLIGSILAFGGDRFDGGMSASGAFAQQAVERERRDAEIDAKLDRLASEIAALRQQQATGAKK